MGNVGSCGAGYKLSQPNWPAFCVPCTTPGEYCPEVLLPTFKPSVPGAGTPLCTVGFALVDGQCVPAREACTQTCADGSAPGGSGLRGICNGQNAGDKCYYDFVSGDQYQGKDYVSSVGCPAALVRTCPACKAGEYRIDSPALFGVQTYCLLPCADYVVRAPSGLCVCAANTIPAASGPSCTSCGPVSLSSPAGGTCKCNAAAGGMQLADGTCGCAMGMHVSGGQCVMSPTMRARQRHRRTDEDLEDGRRRTGVKGRPSSRELQMRRNEAIKRQKRATWT